MRSRARYLLALTLVATALCADRATADVPRPDATPARGLVDRLTDGFRRTVAAPRLVRQRCRVTPAAAAPVVVVRTAAVAAPVVCPARLPLPPPAV